MNVETDRQQGERKGEKKDVHTPVVFVRGEKCIQEYTASSDASTLCKHLFPRETLWNVETDFYFYLVKLVNSKALLEKSLLPVPFFHLSLIN